MPHGVKIAGRAAPPMLALALLVGHAIAANPAADFEADRIANLISGEWKFVGETRPHALAIDASLIPGPPRIDKQAAVMAV